MTERLLVATPRPAATIMLVRDGSTGPEVLLIERSPRSEFMPNLYVFPGGRVDEADHEFGEEFAPPGSEDSRVEDLDGRAETAFRVAAIRELFEEVGILLAQGRNAAALTGDDLAALPLERAGLNAKTRGFADIIGARDLVLETALLEVHGHWITPEMMPQRYDTLFFTALAPPQQSAEVDGRESTKLVWIRPEDAVEQAIKGERRIIFPTRCNLETITGFTRARDILEASAMRPIVPILPTIERSEGAARLIIRSDADYRTTSEDLPALPNGN
jgi:8-oxo-dGTP pyrophosphatase MutT (NUDIX family)